jgi:hypothetical protein
MSDGNLFDGLDNFIEEDTAEIIPHRYFTKSVTAGFNKNRHSDDGLAVSIYGATTGYNPPFLSV